MMNNDQIDFYRRKTDALVLEIIQWKVKWQNGKTNLRSWNNFGLLGVKVSIAGSTLKYIPYANDIMRSREVLVILRLVFSTNLLEWHTHHYVVSSYLSHVSLLCNEPLWEMYGSLDTIRAKTCQYCRWHVTSPLFWTKQSRLWGKRQ